MVGEKFLLLLAMGWDFLIGDPRVAWHPVVLIGRLISYFEAKLMVIEHSPSRKKVAGAILVIIVLFMVYSLAWLAQQALLKMPPMVCLAGSALLLSFTISPRSLAEAGNEIMNFLLGEDLHNARQKVGWIVGRDTHNLDTQEITRATVETVAENIVDGVIAPLFFAVLGGLPLAFLYRAVNTLDSMIGYKNDKYQHFGMVAARVDDIFNYVPARITGILIIVAAFILGYDAKSSAKAIWRDSGNHPSPNSGIPEAGVAGAVGIRLGGLNYYGGIPSFRAYMGDCRFQTAPQHISQAIKIMYCATITFIGSVIVILK